MPLFLCAYLIWMATQSSVKQERSVTAAIRKAGPQRLHVELKARLMTWLSQSLAPRWRLATAMLLENFLGRTSSFRKLLKAVHSIAGCLVSSLVVDDRRRIVDADLALEQRLLH